MNKFELSIRLHYILVLLKDIVRVLRGHPAATMQAVFDLREERNNLKSLLDISLESLESIGSRHRGGSVYARQQHELILAYLVGKEAVL